MLINTSAFASPQARKAALSEISRQIFGNLPVLNQRSGNKILSRKLKGEKVTDFFHKPIQMMLPKGDVYNEVLREDRLRKLDQLKRRGKGPPKKGHGKRASNKKK